MFRSLKLLLHQVISKRVQLDESIAYEVHIGLLYGYAALLCSDVASRNPSSLKFLRPHAFYLGVEGSVVCDLRAKCVLEDWRAADFAFAIG